MGHGTGTNSIFSWKVIKSEYSLIPTIFFCGGACVMCSAYIGYMCMTKPDLSFRPWSWSREGGPYQAVKAGEIRKFMQPSIAPVINPEIEALKREIGSYKA